MKKTVVALFVVSLFVLGLTIASPAIFNGPEPEAAAISAPIL